MNTLVCYYSRSGTTAAVAREIARVLDADIEEIHDNDSRSGPIGYLRSGRHALSKKLADIRPLSHSCSDYDLVVIGTPVWASRMASPVRAMVRANSNQVRAAAIFCTMGSSGAEKTFADMKSELGCPIVAEAAFKAKDVKGPLLPALVEPFAQSIAAAAFHSEQSNGVKPE
jgi:flavodoxin